MPRPPSTKLDIGLATISDGFFADYAKLRSRRAPANQDARRHFAIGWLVVQWVYAIEHGNTRLGADADFVDRGLGAGAFDLLVAHGFIVVRADGPHWTGPGRRRFWLSKDDESPWVTYVVRRGADGPVKIGRSRTLKKRLEHLQNASSERLAVLHELAGDHERRLHAACAAHRTQGEWFDGSDAFFAALAAAIEAIG